MIIQSFTVPLVNMFHFEKSSNMQINIWIKTKKKSIVQLAWKSHFPHSINYKNRSPNIGYVITIVFDKYIMIYQIFCKLFALARLWFLPDNFFHLHHPPSAWYLKWVPLKINYTLHYFEIYTGIDAFKIP